MSALTAPLGDLTDRRPSRPERPALRVVPLNPMRVSRAVFIAFLTVLLAAGMVGVLVLNTTIQQRQTAVSHAQREADDLAWRQASMTAQVEQLRSSSDLATRAWTMGLRPNPHPVFVVLDGDKGSIVGTPTAVAGTEMPDQAYRGADEVAAAIDKARVEAVARRKAEAAQRKAEQKAAQEKAAREKAVREKLAQQKAAQQKSAQQKSAQATSGAKATATQGR